MKKTNPKRLQTVRIHVGNILEMTKSQKWRTEDWLPEVRKCSHERAKGGDSCEGTHLCGDRIHATLGHDAIVLQKIIIGGN